MEVEKITEQRKTTFTVSGIPIYLLKDFKSYAEEECGNSYPVAIFQLMKTKQMYENLVPLISSLIQEVEDLKKPTKQKELKTF